MLTSVDIGTAPVCFWDLIDISFSGSSAHRTTKRWIWMVIGILHKTTLYCKSDIHVDPGHMFRGHVTGETFIQEIKQHDIKVFHMLQRTDQHGTLRTCPVMDPTVYQPWVGSVCYRGGKERNAGYCVCVPPCVLVTEKEFQLLCVCVTEWMQGLL